MENSPSELPCSRIKLARGTPRDTRYMGIYLTQLTAYIQTSHRALAHPSCQDPRTLKTNPNHCHSTHPFLLHLCRRSSEPAHRIQLTRHILFFIAAVAAPSNVPNNNFARFSTPKVSISSSDELKLGCRFLSI